jgi:hypothetical protein
MWKKEKKISYRDAQHNKHINIKAIISLHLLPMRKNCIIKINYFCFEDIEVSFKGDLRGWIMVINRGVYIVTNPITPFENLFILLEFRMKFSIF